ncbi:type IV secretory system conjugative DNA transfer VirD4/TraG family protein [Pontibacter mucosus]|uniref:Type IV secretory system conjugative DNA transfer VirD4/TraG family protein n=1 Tax=Pontibacter mucosus TaxID=1649266 RepID=A0A2T5YEE9_9BACT|nr:conjugal transfer protein MobC [Pontibacter mucosus]PTX15091.1 type IV secretory system conjugative DNA transfer VirD4/TraG family protein [Pontibacter mucosus]
MNTGENIQGLRQVLDFTRLLSLAVLLLHAYIACHAAFQDWGLTVPLADRVAWNFAQLALFQEPWRAKAAAGLLLLVSLLGARGRKDERLKLRHTLALLLPGLLLYGSSHLLLGSASFLAAAYLSTTLLGYLLLLAGGTRLTRLLRQRLSPDIFNRDNQSFPQEERLLENAYSVNLPARYTLRGKSRRSWINIVNPFRALLVIGTPGAGKSYFVIRHVITQHIAKGFALFLYDFKYDDLTRIAYNALLRQKDDKRKFYLINFDDLTRTHRCNPLDPAAMTDITDATEASRTIMLGLNREWIKKQGDFFVESPINFVTAIIWFLRRYQQGRYCTLPHVIELMQADYAELFAVLRTEPEIEVLINPFISAFEHEAMEQLEGQVASAKISMARLVSPQLYYVLSGNDFTLDLNNTQAPKIICLAGNPQKQQVYGAVLSLYVSRAIKLVNQKGRLPSSLVFDEFPTIYFNGIDSLIATARSNRVATTLAVQDYSQLKKDYGREQAEVVMNIVGNIISGQVSGETARQLSERFGKIVQQRQSLSVNSSDTSLSRSTQLDAAVPPATIASLSSGEFVGTVADEPACPITLKAFHGFIENDHQAIAREEKLYRPIPEIRQVTPDAVQWQYRQIKEEVQNMIASILTKGSSHP